MKTLRDFWNVKQQESMKGLPTYHSYCKEKTGVARPGKTARDRWKKAGTLRNAP